MTTTTTDQTVSADDVCEVCGETRENHGDKKHKFSIDGQLIPIEPGPKPSNTPPARAVANDPVARLHLRLVERLVAKGIFDGTDLLYIFGGADASSDGGQVKD